MDTMAWTLRIVEVMRSWPLVILIIVLIFRKDISGLLGRISNHKEGSTDFTRQPNADGTSGSLPSDPRATPALDEEGKTNI